MDGVINISPQKKSSLLSNIAGDQSQGARNYQEDNFLVLDLGDNEGNDSILLLLADGMGGHAGGAEASHVAIHKFAQKFEESTCGNISHRLEESLQYANAKIGMYTQEFPEFEGMGCTLVCVHIDNNIIHWVSVGDSPLWIYRNNILRRLNADHSMVPILKKMVELGELTSAQAEQDSRKNALRSAVSGDKIELIDVNTDGFVLQKNDILLLATDGLETLSETEIGRLLNSRENLNSNEIVTNLLESVENAGRPGQDNTTVVVLNVLDQETQPEWQTAKTKVISSPSLSNTEVKLRPGGSSKNETGISIKSTNQILKVIVIVGVTILLVVLGFYLFGRTNDMPKQDLTISSILEPSIQAIGERGSCCLFTELLREYNHGK